MSGGVVNTERAAIAVVDEFRCCQAWKDNFGTSEGIGMNWYAYEAAANEKGYQHICGIDEAGRGPLAGPVFAAAAYFTSRSYY